MTNVDLKTRSEDGRSRGWALVTFATPEEAASGVASLDGAQLDGRPLRANVDRGPPSTQRFDSASGGGQQNSGGGAGFGSYAEEPCEPSTKIYVGNLPWAVDGDALLQMFEAYSAVGANVIFGHNGRSRGYGIVELASIDDATTAITDINGTDLGGRSLTVRFDGGSHRRADDRGPPKARGGGSRLPCGQPGSSIYVKNLPDELTWQGLKDLFAELAPEFADVKTGADGLSHGWERCASPTARPLARPSNVFNGFSPEGAGGALEVRMDIKA